MEITSTYPFGVNVNGIACLGRFESSRSFFPKNASYYFCKPNIPRGLDEKELALQAKQFDLYGVTYNSVNEAYAAALLKATREDIVFVGGSTFVVAEVV